MRRSWWEHPLPHVAAIAGFIAVFAANLRFEPTGDPDTAEYLRYALAFWRGQPPWHALPVEYPPLALAPFSLTLLPGLVPSTAFELGMLAVILLGYAGFVRYVGPKPALLYLGYLLLGDQILALMRFDIVPALLVVAALWTAQRQRFALGYALLALGALVKLYPLFFAPLVVLAHWRAINSAPHPATCRRALAQVACATAPAGMLLALGFGMAFWRNPAVTLGVFHFALQRPIQAESGPATVLWLGSLLGAPATLDYSYGSVNVVGPLASFIAPLATLAQVGSLLWVFWRYGRGTMPLALAFLALMCALLLTNKVFSAQYLIWALPLVALVAGVSGWWAMISALTALALCFLPFTVIVEPVGARWLFFCMLAVRNGCLAVVTWRLLTGAHPLQYGKVRAKTQDTTTQDKPA